MANVILRVKREDGSWAEIPALVGPEGPQGVSIDDIVLKSQEGGVSTYLILLSDGSEKTFQVTDGAIITDVSLINTNVLIDTYRISISDGSYFEFRVTNGRGIKNIAKTSTDVLSDTYTISYNDNTTSTYTITNGRGIDYIEKDQTIGLSDRYTIHYNDGTTSYYHVVNGEVGPSNVLSIGNVTKGDEASASITGNSPKQVLNLVLPKGDRGDTGPQGPQGIQGPPGETGADKDLSNLTEEGLKVIKDNSGSGLELCDIGMALYIDETKGLRRYLNGQIVDINANTQAFLNRLQEITTLHPSLLCTEEEWQSAKTMSAFGQVGKFVFNYSGDEIVSVRLPRVVNVQGLFDLQNLGMTVSAGLPTHTHTRGTMNITGGFTSRGIENMNMNGWGAFNAQDSTDNLSYGHAKGKGGGFNFDASRSWTGSTSAPNNSIYGSSTTVQQEAIQYPYFIQIATGQETENNIVNDIELNNPYSLFDFKWADHEQNNLSWTRSDTFDWKPSATYPSAYNELLAEYNNAESVEETKNGITFKRTPKGYKIALANQESAVLNKYNNDGIAWYYILDTTNKKFKLPRTKFGFEGLRDGVGNDIRAGLPNHTHALTLHGRSGNNAGINRDTSWCYDDWVGVNSTATTTQVLNNSVYGNSDTVQPPATQMYLYFYVGETVQNSSLIDAGRIGEILPTKTDMQQAAKASMPSSRYIDLTLGASGSTYTAPANGWLQCACTGTAGSTFFELVHPVISCCASFNGGWGRASMPVTKGMVITVYYGGNNFTNTIFRFTYAEGSK